MTRRRGRPHAALEAERCVVIGGPFAPPIRVGRVDWVRAFAYEPEPPAGPTPKEPTR